MLIEDIAVLCVLPKVWRRYFIDAFREHLAPVRFVTPDDTSDPADISYAFVLAPPPGYLAGFPNLKAIMPVGAGVEHVLADPDLPNIPIVRMVQPDMTQRMSEYIVQHALNHTRGYRQIQAAQARKEWNLFACRAAPEVTVGILGLGTLGQHAGEMLSAVGFKVRGWSRTPKELSGIEAYWGKKALPAFLSCCDILVSLLPLTSETRNLVDNKLLSSLRPGASFINASRGGVVNDSDLIECLDTGLISQATLDAFDVEPLPVDHPFWSHPRVTVTPHCASAATAEAVAARLRLVIETVERGETPAPVVNRDAGY